MDLTNMKKRFGKGKKINNANSKQGCCNIPAFIAGQSLIPKIKYLQSVLAVIK